MVVVVVCFFFSCTKGGAFPNLEGPVVVSILTSLPKSRLTLGSNDNEALPLKNDRSTKIM